MNRVRTPDERFVNLPDFPFESKYANVADPTGGEALRMAYLDEGPSDGDVVVLLHGAPTWSFLYRHMIPGLIAARHRVIAPDLIGFGRSDKLSNRRDFTFARHVEWTRSLLFDHLQLSDITFFGQDWGSLVGLRLVAEHPERFARVAISNGGLPTGDEKPNDAFLDWRDFSQNAPELPIGRIISGGCVTRLSEEVIAAYDAPFPDESYKEGAREFPKLVPTSIEDPAHDANVAAWASLEKFTKPFLLCFSDGDPITHGGEKRFLREIPGTKDQAHTTIEGGGHFVQEEKGPELAAVVNTFISAT
jgi:haloalkane dehalogenase